jgi:hypothetical protein
MKRRRIHGVSSVEFAFSMLVLAPLLLGTGVIGVNMIRTIETIQLARDAAHMYARGVDFGQPGNKTLLVTLGSQLGLTNSSLTSTSVVILSGLVYIDKAACATVGAVDSSGNPNGCTNYTKWVFAQRLILGNPSIRSSNYGSPLTSGPTGVTVDPSTGRIAPQEYTMRAGAIASFSSINPYAIVDGVAQGLPSGQVLYLAEASATGMNMAPFVSNAATYSFCLF